MATGYSSTKLLQQGIPEGDGHRCVEYGRIRNVISEIMNKVIKMNIAVNSGSGTRASADCRSFAVSADMLRMNIQKGAGGYLLSCADM